MTENNVTDITEATRLVAVEQGKQGKFNFLDRLNGRNYPTETVEIFLDEEAGLAAMELQEAIAHEADGEKVNAMQAELEALGAKLAESKYTLSLRGISTEEYDATVDAAREAHPVEFRDVMNPLTFAREREVVESEAREQLFRNLLWAKYIESVTDHEGNVDDDITPELVAVFCLRAPIMAPIKVSEAVEKLRMTTAWMDELQGADFFPKP